MIIILFEPEDIYKIWQIWLEVWFVTNNQIRPMCGHDFIAFPYHALALRFLLE